MTWAAVTLAKKETNLSSFLRLSDSPCFRVNAVGRDLLRSTPSPPRPPDAIIRTVMPTPTPHWVCDPELGERFVQTSLRFAPDYDGEVTATLVRNEPLVSRARGAVLYLHGFIDYFFQSHVADAFNTAGYNFYALDLRKFGRSLGGAAHPNFCRDFKEYFPEITSAIDIITTVEHHETLVVEGTLHRCPGRRALREDWRSSGPRGPAAFPQSVSRVSAGRRALASWRVLGTAVSLRTHHGTLSPWDARSLHVDSKASGASTRGGNHRGVHAFSAGYARSCASRTREQEEARSGSRSC